MLSGLKIKNCMILLLGSAIQAFGIYNIHALSNVTEGGALGLTLLLHHWFGISPAVSSLILNIACFAFGWKTLGKDFLGYSLLSIVVYSGCYRILECFPPLWPNIGQFPLSAALLGALFIGTGVGLCVRAGGSTAGDDAIAMSFSHRFGWPIERVYLVTDLAVLLLSLSYIPARRIVYSMLTAFLSGQIIGLVQKIKISQKRATP